MKILFLNQAPAPLPYDQSKIESLLNGYASPGTTIEIGCPEEFGDGDVLEALGGKRTLNPLRHIIRGPALVQKILWAEQSGYDAVIQSNTFDPGVEGGRMVVKIPVVGLFRTAMHVGLSLSDRIGITVPLATHVSYAWRILRSYGLESFVVGIRTLPEEVFPEGVFGAPVETIQKFKDEIAGSAISIAQDLVARDGAEMILPLGGAVIPYVVDTVELERAAGVPVLNTKSIGIRFAEMCVNLGLTQSPLTYARTTRVDD